MNVLTSQKKLTIVVLYQDIDSGSRVATEAIVQNLKKNYPLHTYILYKQKSSKYFGPFSFTRNLFWSISDFKKKLDTIPSVDIVYSPIYTSAVAHTLSSAKEKPYVFHFHGDQRFGKLIDSKQPLFFLQKAYNQLVQRIVLYLQKFAVTHSDISLFVSAGSKREFVGKYAISPKTITTAIVPNGVDTEIFRPVTKLQKRSLKIDHGLKNYKTITYVGRIDPKKGIHQLIESLQFLSQKKLQVLLIHPKIGDKHSSSYFKLLHQMIHTHYQKKKTLLIRFIENPLHIHEYYQISDCVVLPSEQEMMPLVMLEACACGVPFITSKAGAALQLYNADRELLKYCVLNIVSPQEIATKIDALFSLSSSQKNHIIHSQLKIARQFTWSNSAKKVLLALESTTQ